MSSENENIKRIAPGRELTKKEQKTIRNLTFLSPKQEEAVREAWKQEAESLGGLKHSIIFNLIAWVSIAALAANVVNKNVYTTFADNIISFAVFIFALMVIAAAFIYHKIADSTERNVIFSHTGIMLLEESGFVRKYFGKLTAITFILLYIGNGHLYTGAFLVIAMLILLGSARAAQENVKRELNRIT